MCYGRADALAEFHPPRRLAKVGTSPCKYRCPPPGHDSSTVLLAGSTAVMNRERWQRVETLFHEALARPPSDREAFLDSACEGDEAMRQDVESLLAQRSLVWVHSTGQCSPGPARSLLPVGSR